MDCRACNPEAHALCGCKVLCDAHWKAEQDAADQARDLMAERAADYNDDGHLS